MTPFHFENCDSIVNCLHTKKIHRLSPFNSVNYETVYHECHTLVASVDCGKNGKGSGPDDYQENGYGDGDEGDSFGDGWSNDDQTVYTNHNIFIDHVKQKPNGDGWGHPAYSPRVYI